ncbi:MAG: hypothetical protein QG584_2632 [Pseudomonadota bacterium]|nr:hypothetical protein [Pseudomonadota bacterium]
MSLQDIYNIINPLPAMLLEKGRINPRVSVDIEANTSRVYIWLIFRKVIKPTYEGEESRILCVGNTFDEAMENALKKISELPSAKDENTHNFMRELAALIESGDKIGLDLEYMAPLTDAMKKLTDNILTYQPQAKSDDIPF